MKTRIPLPVATSHTADHAPQRRAASARTTTPLRQMADHSVQVGLLQRLQADADGYAQRRALTVQRAGADEEELLQGRFKTTQLAGPEEEELGHEMIETGQEAGLEENEALDEMSESAEVIGLEDEELLQGKFETAQAAGLEEEEPLQARFERVTGRSEPVLRRVDPTTTVNGVPVNDDPALEHEADVMGAKAAQFVPLFRDASVQGPFGNISVLVAQRKLAIEKAKMTLDPDDEAKADTEIKAKAAEKSDSATHQGHMKQGGKIKDLEAFGAKRRTDVLGSMLTQKRNREVKEAEKGLAKEVGKRKPDEAKIAQLMLETSVSRQPESSAKLNNTGLPDKLKAGIEHYSGASLDGVKVHYNSEKPAQLNALAYAQGTDIHLAPGQEQHLPHEAWHVVQQNERYLSTAQCQVVAQLAEPADYRSFLVDLAAAGYKGAEKAHVPHKGSEVKSHFYKDKILEAHEHAQTYPKNNGGIDMVKLAAVEVKWAANIG